MVGDELSFEELKSIICDTDDQLGTDELLGLISDFLGDDDISKVINTHIDNLDEHWRWTIKANEAFDLIEAVIPSITDILKKVRTNDKDNDIRE